MKIFHPFLLLSLISVFIQAAFQYLLISDQLYFNALSEQLAYERIEELISQGKKWQWVGYAVAWNPCWRVDFVMSPCGSIRSIQNGIKWEVRPGFYAKTGEGSDLEIFWKILTTARLVQYRYRSLTRFYHK